MMRNTYRPTRQENSIRNLFTLTSVPELRLPRRGSLKIFCPIINLHTADIYKSMVDFCFVLSELVRLGYVYDTFTHFTSLSFSGRRKLISQSKILV